MKSFFRCVITFTALFLIPCSLHAKNQSLIVLDPGHGGFDIGAQVAKLKEKTLALQTAKKVQRHLKRMGYRVVLTRMEDKFIPLKKRAKIANQTKCHLFVSIHYNAHPKAVVKGIEIFYYKKGNKRRANSSKKVAKKVLSFLIAKTKAVSRGVKHGNFHVIRETTMPAILIEGGFMTHPKERVSLSSQAYLDQIALAIAQGIDTFLSS